MRRSNPGAAHFLSVGPPYLYLSEVEHSAAVIVVQAIRGRTPAPHRKPASSCAPDIPRLARVFQGDAECLHCRPVVRRRRHGAGGTVFPEGPAESALPSAPRTYILALPPVRLHSIRNSAAGPTPATFPRVEIESVVHLAAKQPFDALGLVAMAP